MAKIPIETYRGWEIKFDTEKETFGCFSDDFDHQAEKKSFASVKKYIDEYLKANLNFKPFVIIRKPNAYSWHKRKKINVIGIRKDGAFTLKDNDGVRMLSRYDEESYSLYIPENDSIVKELEQAEAEKKAIEDRIKEINERYKVVSLAEIKKRYTT